MAKSLEQRAGAVVEQLVDVPAADRQAAAVAACGADGPLLDRVRSLLSALPMVDGFMDATTDGPDFPAVATVGEKPGDTIGRYKLLEKIGEGGFGVVFTAEQQKPVRRLVAIKVIKLGMDTREVVARFEAERQALALMDHPNIAKVLDAGSTDAGRPYFVMELVRGSPVTEYADKHKLSTKDRVALAAQICRAVQHAHSKGVIHRDLKPSNVLVTVTDDKPVPKVIDFGIAKATQSRLTERTLFTAHRQLIGTPQYMSPEQADSDGSDIDTRTDVYSMGVVIYELLVGTTPLDARSLRSAAYEAMRKMISEGEPAKPSTKLSSLGESLATVATNRSTDPKQLGKQLHGELDWIVMKSLEKDRSRRYETAAALADDLGRYLSGEAVLAGPVSGAYRLKKTLKRYKAAVVIGGVIAACLLLGVAGTTWGFVREAKQRKEAVVQRQEADAERQSAQAVVDFLTHDLLSKADPASTRDRTLRDTLVKVLIEPALATVEDRFRDQPRVRAAVQSTLAITLIGLGRFDLAEGQAKAAWDTERAVYGDDNRKSLQGMCLYTVSMNKGLRYAPAEPVAKQCWDACRRVLGDDDPDTLRAMLNYGTAEFGQAKYAEAEPVYKRCWEGYRRVNGDENIQTLSAMCNYGLALRLQRHYAEAEPLLKRNWEGKIRLLGEDHPETVDALHNYAAVLGDLHRLPEAEPLAKRSYEISRRVLGDDHASTFDELLAYASAISSQGRYAEAEPLYKQCWESARRVLGEDHPTTVGALTQYASSIQMQHRTVEAEPWLKKAWEANRRTIGDDRLFTIWMLGSYAQVLIEQERYAEAEPLLKQAWNTAPRVLGEDDTTTLATLYFYATAIDGQGRHSQAEPMFKQCWGRYRRVLGDDEVDTNSAMGQYAVSIDSQGRHTEAEVFLRKALDVLNRLHPDDTEHRWTALLNLGRCLVASKRWAEAEPLLRESWILGRQYADPGRPVAVPENLRLLNQCLEAQGKPAAVAATTRATAPATRP